MRTEELLHWIKERWRVRQAREAGKPKPWTTDPIIQQYRFCNVHREDDAVTRWVTDNWRTPHANDPDFWFAAYVARVFNLPNTLEAIGYPVPYTSSVRKRMEKLATSKANVFNSSYIVSTNGIAGPKLGYCIGVFDRVWAARKELRPIAGEPLAAFAGLNWVCEREFDAPWKEADWHARLMELKPIVDKFAVKNRIPPIHAQDLNNVLCETFKYVRGYAKCRYPGA